MADTPPPTLSSSSTAATVGNTSATGTTPTSSRTTLAQIMRRPMPRKGHTKSRKGCYSCKNRKVKCTENLPECIPCKRIGLICEYPSLLYRKVAINSASPSLNTETRTLLSGPANPLRTAPTSFDMDDMRFFSHFILVAYPHLPFNGKQVWMDAVQMSHQYECLMHAVLALAATDLTFSTTSNYSFQALSHRVLAIRSLHTMLSKPGRTFTTADGDAVFGALMSLVFQSTYLPDCMLDFVAMVRGCQILSVQVIPDQSQSVFRSFIPEVHKEIFFENIKFSTTYACSQFADLLVSLRALGTLCRSVIELSFLADIQKLLQLYLECPIQAYAYLPNNFGHFGRMNSKEFAVFCNPSNYTAQILLAHFFLIEYYIDMSISLDSTHVLHFRRQVMPKWIEKVADALSPEHVPYMKQALDLARSEPI